MRHLISVDTHDEADEIVQLFHASGIPVFVEADYTRTDPSSRGATFGFRVHIWLEEQLDDAKRLLNNPDYEVVSPVNVEQFFAAMKEHDGKQEAAWPRKEEQLLNRVVGITVVGLAAWIAYAVLWP